jgi:hypothetical protein
VLAGKQPGDRLSSRDVVALVQDRYEARHGHRPERGPVFVALSERFNEAQAGGLIRVVDWRRGVGGFKTWVVVGPEPASPQAPEAPVPTAPAPVGPPASVQGPPATVPSPAPEASSVQAPEGPASAPPAPVQPPASVQGPPATVPPPAPEESSVQAPEGPASAAASEALEALQAEHRRNLEAITALRNRVAELERELVRAHEEVALARFFEQVRVSKMRIVVEPV